MRQEVAAIAQALLREVKERISKGSDISLDFGIQLGVRGH